MAEHIRIIAHVTAQQGKADALSELLQTLIEPTRKEPGCLMYVLWRHAEQAHRFCFVEEWADKAAFEAHLKTPHIAHVLEHGPQLLAAPFDLETYELVA